MSPERKTTGSTLQQDRRMTLEPERHLYMCQPARVYKNCKHITICMQVGHASTSKNTRKSKKRNEKKIQSKKDLRESYTACSPTPFISAISYSPPSLCKPRSRPLPRDGLPLSTGGSDELPDDCPAPLPAIPPKLIGLSSRHWQAQIPPKVIREALAN